MKKIDIILALIIGEIVAWFFFGILKNLEVEIGILSLALLILFPILSVLGLWIAFLIGKKFLFVYQIAKFFLIGALATVADIALLNLLFWIFGIATGIYFSVFKGVSFLIATSSKYLGDKFWAFEKMEKVGMRKEFSQFFAVTLGGLIINVGVASYIVNVFGAQFGISEKIWANIGAIIAAFSTIIWNFIGYKFLVFKK